MIRAIVFDLDDTLYPEIEYVKSGFRAIAKEFDDSTLYDKLYQLFCKDRQNVYQRAGFNDEECRKCIEIYRNHMPDISLEKSVVDTLNIFKGNYYKLGIITDGRPEGQHNKIAALGLDRLMDCIIVTDELGGVEFRKPHPKAFDLMRDRLGVEFDEMIYVGDNPLKDFYIKKIYPIYTVELVSEGIYRKNAYKENVKSDCQIKNFSNLKNILM